ncbi:MAG: helix-turn-helix transcriptional regulator [Pseudomonadota bacterium]
MNKTDTQYRPLRTSAELSGIAVRQKTWQPPVDLAEYVIEFWEYELAPGLDSVPVQVFPSGCLSMRFNINSMGVEPVLYGPSLRSKMRGWFYHDWTICGAALHPQKGYHLLGLSLSELQNLRIQFDCFWPQATRRVCEQIAETISFEQRVTVMSNFLREIIREDVAPSSSFLNAYHDILGQAPGNLEIRDVAAQAGTHGRALRRQFSKYLGISPKQTDRMLRVQQAIQQLSCNPNISLATLAINLGFSDQPHFTREFKAFTSCSPSEFATRVGRFNYRELDIWAGMDPERNRYRKPPPVVRFEM